MVTIWQSIHFWLFGSPYELFDSKYNMFILLPSYLLIHLNIHGIVHTYYQRDVVSIPDTNGYKQRNNILVQEQICSNKHLKLRDSNKGDACALIISEERVNVLIRSVFTYLGIAESAICNQSWYNNVTGTVQLLQGITLLTLREIGFPSALSHSKRHVGGHINNKVSVHDASTHNYTTHILAIAWHILVFGIIWVI